jgi:Na+/melibiose symporter-like transporter
VHIWAYGVGHFVNDLTAACWFNYLLYFLNKVVGTTAAPAALLSGQICDGIATPIVGLLSDKFNFSIGQRKPWYIAGLVLVVTCFIPLWSGFESDSLGSMYAFYTIFGGLFNVGWAALQISHMSLVPSLTCSRKRRVPFP